MKVPALKASVIPPAYTAYLERVVASIPPLTHGQREHIAELLSAHVRSLTFS